MGTRGQTNASSINHAAGELAGDPTHPAAGRSAGELEAGHAAGASDGAGAGAGAVNGMEPLGLVGADPASLAAEVAAAVPGAAAPAGELEAISNASWATLTPPGVQVLSAVIFPAWEITPAEQGEIAPALAECLEQLFPGGINGRYACWLRLVICCGGITVSRAVQNGGRIPPLFVTKEQAALRSAAAGRKADQAPAAAPAAKVDEPLRPDQLTSLGV